VKAVAFDYTAPRDVETALAALSGEGTKLIAGGQSLGPMLNLRLARPRLLIDISRIEALHAIEDRGDRWWIASAVTHAMIEDRLDGMLQTVAAGIAYRSVRTRGTIGGSMAHADPAADWPLALIALGADIHIRGADECRRVSAGSFMHGAFTTELADTELIEGIEVPKPSPSARWGYYKFCRKTGEFPEASAAVLLDPERCVANVVVGALDSAPRRCDALAQQLAQRRSIDADAFREAVDAIGGLDAVAVRMHAAALARAVRQAMPS
jgi:carbon-monoxide dehydrogenase medium subunit